MTKHQESISKYLSNILRHKPEKIGLELDDEGWAEIEKLIELSNISGRSLTYDTVQEVVETSDKQRFAISPDGKRIRANQGHSVSVNLGLVSCEPPPFLFHGTAVRFIDSIRKKGLIPGSRQHVHLSSTTTTASIVGSRHGIPVVLIVRALEMYRDGFAFWRSDNGVWLTLNVPFRYLDFPNNPET